MRNVHRENTAVVIVDMQKGEKQGITEEEWSSVEDSIAHLLETAREAHMSIIHIFYSPHLMKDEGPFQYEADSDPFTHLNHTGDSEPLPSVYHIVEKCYPRPREWMFAKMQSDAFAQRNWLRKTPQLRHVRNVILSGVRIGDCLGKTAISASRRYNTFVPPETTDSEYDGGRHLERLQKRGIETPSLQTIMREMAIQRVSITTLFNRTMHNFFGKVFS